MAKVAPIEAQPISVVPVPETRTPSHQSSQRPSQEGPAPVPIHLKPRRDAIPDHTSLGLVLAARHEAKFILSRSGWYESHYAGVMRKFLRGRFFTCIAVVALFLALFMSELFSLCQVSSNIELDVILTFVLFVFAFEFIGLVLTDTSYLFSFFFWMDFVGTLSMFFDISYISPFVDVTKPVRKADGGAHDNIIVVRAVRAAKLGARAGRIGRGIRLILPFISGKDNNPEEKVKMAKVISNQLTNVLSTRVAFLSIMIVVSMPFLSLYMYPTDDGSMESWVTLLNRNTEMYLGAADGPYKVAQKLRLEKELRSFSQFYSGLEYGVYGVCIGKAGGEDTFNCDPLHPVAFQSDFTMPARKSSIVEVSSQNFQASFNLATIKQRESAASIALLAFVIVVMCGFGLLLSSSISKIALQPLERMLSVVREHCQQIFKYTDLLEEEEDEDMSEDAQDYDDMEGQGEFKILEKVVMKLTGIVNVAIAKDCELKEDMDENDIMAMNFINGGNVQASGHDAQRFQSSRPEMESDYKPHIQTQSIFANSIPSDIIDLLEGIYFDSLALSKEMKISVAGYVLAMSEGSRAFTCSNVQESHLLKFVTVCESKYPPNPFHNFGHGVDVLYSVSRYMRLVGVDGFLRVDSQFGLMVAAVGHDLGHLCVNNQYLVETAHELAVRYNDRSPLENMHCATLFQVVSDPEANIFSQLEKDVYKDMRKLIINAILHTDVVKHNDMIKELSLLYQMNSDQFDQGDPSEAITSSQTHVQAIINAFLHTADIANPMKPFELAKPLAYLCIDEFFAQGDKEKAAGIPVQMLNDRDKVNRPNSQLGFLEFVILPLVEAVVSMFVQLEDLADNLGANLGHWADVWMEETHPPEEAAAKVKARVHKAGLRCKMVTRAERGLTY